MKRAVVLVLDSFGIGASEDAEKFGDQGANTFLHIAQSCAQGQCETARTGRLALPNLQALGLAQACQLSCHKLPLMLEHISPNEAGWGVAKEASTAKDTTSGHWEMMGLPVLFDWGYFTRPTESFPRDFLQQFICAAQLPGILGNCQASGTDVIKQYGSRHLDTHKPICYTSADSVFQIAYHEDVWTPKRAEQVCLVARELLDAHKIARVIARPFSGSKPENFQRTVNRKDYSMEPPASTLLDQLLLAGKEVVGVGKISDIFAARGISQSLKAHGLEQLMTETVKAFAKVTGDKLVFTNLVDFDTRFGHRRDVNGYACELEKFDSLLGELFGLMRADDLLIISADHGCDPTFAGTDHTREHVPVLVKGNGIKGCLGMRDSFADIGQSLANYFGLEKLQYGESFIA